MNLEQGKRYALSLLSHRMYTCFEINEKLIKKGVSPEEAEEAVGWLLNLGYLDDKKYAEFYINDAVKFANKGMFRIKQELSRKGIAKSIVDEAAEEAEISVEDVLAEYVRRKIGDETELSYKEMARLKNHLARRGYSYGDITRCFDLLEIKISRGEEY